MTFKDVIERIRLEMVRPTPSAEEIQGHIFNAYGFTKSTVLMMSYNHVRMLVDGTLWSMEQSWQRDKFERLVRLGP